MDYSDEKASRSIRIRYEFYYYFEKQNIETKRVVYSGGALE
jgi:hypothetical protein